MPSIACQLHQCTVKNEIQESFIKQNQENFVKLNQDKFSIKLILSTVSATLQATVCAKFGLECIVYMGAKDMERQKLNVFRMRLLGAQVRAVTSGTATLKDATSEAIRDWVTNVETTHYILGSAAGPHPYPMMVGNPPCR